MRVRGASWLCTRVTDSLDFSVNSSLLWLIGDGERREMGTYHLQSHSEIDNQNNETLGWPWWVLLMFLQLQETKSQTVSKNNSWEQIMMFWESSLPPPWTHSLWDACSRVERGLSFFTEKLEISQTFCLFVSEIGCLTNEGREHTGVQSRVLGQRSWLPWRRSTCCQSSKIVCQNASQIST